MKRISISVLSALLMLCIFSIAGAATPVYCAGSGHYYEVVEKGMAWEDAKNDAQSLSYAGMNGHLATITSQEENDFILANLVVKDSWLGGLQPADGQEPAGDWQWVTSEPWVYTNFEPGEPDNNYLSNYGDLHPAGYAENALQFHASGDGLWNDIPGDFQLGSYVIEYETVSPPEVHSPVAAFTINVTSGYAPLTVAFKDKSAYGESWSWDFGDGNVASDRSPIHTYTRAGTFTARLTVTNSGGSSSSMKNINVMAVPKKPVARFAAEEYAPMAVQFTDQSTNNPDTWTWDFGDGVNSQEQNPKHTYAKVGKYAVKLAVSNTGGVNVAVKSDYIPVINIPAEASFEADVTKGAFPLSVQFTDTSKHTPTFWKWDFGDGKISDQQNPTHVYEQAGKYTVTLSATNAGGSDVAIRNRYIKVMKK